MQCRDNLEDDMRVYQPVAGQIRIKDMLLPTFKVRSLGWNPQHFFVEWMHCVQGNEYVGKT